MAQSSSRYRRSRFQAARFLCSRKPRFSDARLLWISATCPPRMDGSDPFCPYSRGLTLIYLPKDLTTVEIPSSDLTIQIDPDVAPFSTALWTWKNQRSRCSHGAQGSTIQISSLFTKIEEKGLMALNALVYSLDSMIVNDRRLSDRISSVDQYLSLSCYFGI
jgi:hypothetical protein